MRGKGWVSGTISIFQSQKSMVILGFSFFPSSFLKSLVIGDTNGKLDS